MKISSFQSLNGTTWVLSEGFCVLGYTKSKAEANRELRERRKQARERAEANAAETDEFRKEREERERRDARADPRQMSLKV